MGSAETRKALALWLQHRLRERNGRHGRERSAPNPAAVLSSALSVRQNRIYKTRDTGVCQEGGAWFAVRIVAVQTFGQTLAASVAREKHSRKAIGSGRAGVDGGKWTPRSPSLTWGGCNGIANWAVDQQDEGRH